MATEQQKQNLWETIKSALIAITIAFAFRSFAYQPFHIPSGSMKGSLLIGDYLFASKYSYGYSRYSFPFGLPIFSGRIFESIPKRGDVVIFRIPTNTNIDYIKRLVGLPGDKIQVKDSILYINGKAIPRRKVEDFTDEDGTKIPQYEETLPNGVKYLVLDEESRGQLDNTMVYTVPEGHYFCMGDNRDNSTDSRVLNHVGFVPAENIVGKAQMVFFSVGGGASFFEFWKWGTEFRGDRFFNMI